MSSDRLDGSPARITPGRFDPGPEFREDFGFRYVATGPRFDHWGGVEEGEDADVLEDVLRPGLRLVVCGMAAGKASAAAGAYYAGPGNRFWPTLHEVGLTPRRLQPREYRDLLSLGIGLTDVAKDQSGADAELDPDRIDPEHLRAKLLRFEPSILAFNGKGAARAFLGARHVDLGPQEVRVGRTRLFVAPSTSGLAARYWDFGVWQDLARLVRGLEAERGTAVAPAQLTRRK